MFAAFTAVDPALLASNAVPVEIVSVAALWLGYAEIDHNRAPFGTVRPGSTVACHRDQVGDLVGDGGGEKVRFVTACNSQVVAQQGGFTVAPLHLPGCLAAQVEADDRVRYRCAVRPAQWRRGL